MYRDYIPGELVIGNIDIKYAAQQVIELGREIDENHIYSGTLGSAVGIFLGNDCAVSLHNSAEDKTAYFRFNHSELVVTGTYNARMCIYNKLRRAEDLMENPERSGEFYRTGV